MSDIELVIKISEEDYQLIKHAMIVNTHYPITRRMYDAIQNGKVFPKNATNGDVIKAMFPNIEILDSGNILVTIKLLDIGQHIAFFKDWWNAPYKPDMVYKNTR